MNIRDDIKQLKTGDRDLRKFGLVVGGVFAALGLLFLLRHKVHYPYFLWPGALLVAFGEIRPQTLKWIYIAWMSMAVALGFAVSQVVLTVFFFLVITPIGLIARLVGRDFLGLKLDHAAKSYWIPRVQKTKSPAEYERQF